MPTFTKEHEGALESLRSIWCLLVLGYIIFSLRHRPLRCTRVASRRVACAGFLRLLFFLVMTNWPLFHKYVVVKNGEAWVGVPLLCQPVSPEKGSFSMSDDIREENNQATIICLIMKVTRHTALVF